MRTLASHLILFLAACQSGQLSQLGGDVGDGGGLLERDAGSQEVDAGDNDAGDQTNDAGGIGSVQTLGLDAEGAQRRAAALEAYHRRCGDSWIATGDFTALLASIATSLERGHVEYDGARARNCYAALDTLPCGQRPPDCSWAGVTSRQSPGDVCDANHDCLNGQCLEGRCVALVAGGGRCEKSADCAARFYCHRERCVVRALTEGDLCVPRVSDCGDLYCFLDVERDLRCSPPASLGDACIDPHACAPGLFCVGGTCSAEDSPNRVCRRHADCDPELGCFADPSGSFASCSSPIGQLCEPRRLSCVGPFACRRAATRTSQCAAPAGNGEPCGDVPCLAGLECVIDTCGQPGGMGARCAENDDCGPGLFCPREPESPTCTPRSKQEDDRCQEQECVDGLLCLFNRCHRPRDANEACEISLECQPDLFCDNGICARQKAVGEPCTRSAECMTSCSSDGVCRFVFEGGHCSDRMPCSEGLLCQAPCNGACEGLKRCEEPLR